MEFSEKLKYIRSQESITQQQLGDRLNTSRKTVSNWENGRSYPDISTLLNISNFFNLSLNELLDKNMSIIKYYDNNKLVYSRYSKVFKISYRLNIILIIISFITAFNPMHTNVKYFTFLILINIIIGVISNTHPKIIISKFWFFILIIFFFFLQINLQLSMHDQFFYKLLNGNIFFYGELTGIILRTFVITVGFSMIFISNKD